MKNIGFILMICMMTLVQVSCDNEDPRQMSVTSDMFLQITNRKVKVSNDGKYYILTECINETTKAFQVQNIFIVDLEEDAAKVAELNVEYVLVGGVGQKTDYRPANVENGGAYYMLKITELKSAD